MPETFRNVILPNSHADEKDMRGPLFFFGGPDQGSDDWRLKGYLLLEKVLGANFCAAMPCRYESSHLFMTRRLPPGGPAFERRLLWVRYYASEAGFIRRPRGCALYYFPKESTLKPRDDGLPYASKSLFEIGEWLGNLKYDPRKTRFVLGIESGFPGREPIVSNFKEALRGHTNFKVYKTLEDTVEAAVRRTMMDDWYY